VTTLDITSFGGEIPRLPNTALPPTAAQHAVNCDLAHVELRGLLGMRLLADGLSVSGTPVKSVYTEDGVNFFGWPYDTYVVKSMVVGDQYYRIYYNSIRPDGPFLKVARLYRWWPLLVGPALQVIGTGLVGGNFHPPEGSNPIPQGGNGQGPDCWLLGVTPPQMQGVADTDLPTVKLVDKPSWPGIPRLQFRVTYLLEDLSGQVVAQQDISNTEHPDALDTATSTLPQVMCSATGATRANKIQDTFYSFGGTLTNPYPTGGAYKNYFFDPPDLGTLHVARTVTIDNNGSGPINIVYGASTPDPGASDPGTEGGQKDGQ
jgi:hypothetical protein